MKGERETTMIETERQNDESYKEMIPTNLMIAGPYVATRASHAGRKYAGNIVQIPWRT